MVLIAVSANKYIGVEIVVCDIDSADLLVVVVFGIDTEIYVWVFLEG